MIRDFFVKIYGNKVYFILALIISFYVYLPDTICLATILAWLGWFASVFLLFLIAGFSINLFILIAIIVLLSNILTLHVWYHWGPLELPDIIQLIILSPHREAKEYLETYIGYFEIFILIYVLFGLFLLFKLKKSYKEINLKKYFLIFFIFVFILISFVKNPFHYVYPYNLPFKVFQAIKLHDKALIREKFLKTHEMLLKDKKTLYDKIFIVIGESANRNHFGVYGYSRNTTPFFSKLVNDNNFYIFNNIISPANQTNYAVPTDLSQCRAKQFNKFYHSFSLVSLFNTLGYTTYWLSNQSKNGKSDSNVATIANEANIVYFNNLSYETAKFDEELIPILNKYQNKTKKQVFFIHLIGSHVRYKDRYPSNYKLIKYPKSVIDEYDNTIYYTDYVLSKIFDIAKTHKKFLFIYFSDHSEHVGTKAGHGFAYPRTHKDEYQIPFVVYSSIKNPKLIKLKKFNEQYIINLENLYNIVDYLNRDTQMIRWEELNDTTIMAPSPSKVVKYSDLKR